VALLPVPQPYDFELASERFRVFGDDLLWRWRDGALHRVVAGQELRIRPASGGLDVDPLPEPALPTLRRLLGLELDLDGFLAHAAHDPVLAPVTAQLRGYRPMLVPDPLEMLVASVTAQQVSLLAATAVRNRLVLRFGTAHGEASAFPPRDALAAAEPEELVALGFSRRKAETVVDLARSDLDFDALARMPDAEVRAAITALRGFGDWSADWFLARHLGRPHAWPGGDLGVRKAVGHFCLDGRMPSIEESRALGERFAPHENLTVHFLLLGHRMAR
jgi:3-methyladenine DNA glycosylase/8-oxoguanine DNA glycosylase